MVSLAVFGCCASDAVLSGGAMLRSNSGGPLATSCPDTRPGIGMLLAQYPAVLPTVILAQILVTWWAVAYFSRVRSR